MKTEGKVRQKYKQAKFRARSSLLESRLAQKPCNCIYRSEVSTSTDTSRVVACNYGEITENPEWGVSVCTPGICSGCPSFVASDRSDELKEGFNRLVESAERGEGLGPLAATYPDLAALLWVVGTDAAPSTDEEPAPEDQEPAPEDQEVSSPEEPALGSLEFRNIVVKILETFHGTMVRVGHTPEQASSIITEMGKELGTEEWQNSMSEAITRESPLIEETPDSEVVSDYKPLVFQGVRYVLVVVAFLTPITLLAWLTVYLVHG